MPSRPERYPTVLVADDDELLRYALRTALESDGCHVIEAESGAGAVDIVRSETVDAVILDAHMPGWSVGASLDALRPHAENDGLAVIVISGTAVVCGDYPPFVLSCLRKPFGLETLKTLIRSTTVNQNSAGPERSW